MMTPTILWFRRDLRLQDHAALTAAVARGGPVFAVFICDALVESLGAAIVEITNPEQSASMAYAAWNIISEGAELTDTLVEQIVEHFDRSGL